MLRTADRSTGFQSLSSAAVLFAAIALPGCGGDDSSGDGGGGDSGGGDSSETTKVASAAPSDMFEAVNGLLDGNDPSELWRLLPNSYQSDVNGIISEFSGKMDAATYDKGFAVFGKLAKVLDEKGDFILGYPMLQMFTAQADPAEMKAGLNSVAKTLDALANSDIKTLDGLKGLNVESFLTSTIGDSMKGLLETAGTVGGAMGESDLPEKMGIAILSESDDSAVVEVTDTDGTKNQVEMTKVEGKWIPADLATEWATQIADAKTQLASFELTKDDKMQATMMMTMVENVLDTMLQAEEQEDFNDTIDSMMQMADSLGGGMGG